MQAKQHNIIKEIRLHTGIIFRREKDSNSKQKIIADLIQYQIVYIMSF